MNQYEIKELEVVMYEVMNCERLMERFFQKGEKPHSLPNWGFPNEKMKDIYLNLNSVAVQLIDYVDELKAQEDPEPEVMKEVA